jgi:predicted acyl esterase
MARSAFVRPSLWGALALVAGCARSDLPDGSGLTRDEARAVSSSFEVRESVEQLHVFGAAPELALELLSPAGELVASATTDALGSFIFRKLAPGEGYRLRVAADHADYTDGLEVMSVASSLPADPDAFYAQPLRPGFNYITTRDGTTLSAYVTLPGPVEKGPYPTVVNYSGYEPSHPGVPIEGAEVYCEKFPILCDAPRDQSALIAGLMGYATIGVNLRGTGCSGGAYDYFETLQTLDGYDVIEVAGRQSWVLHGKVGMTGLSYPGITQLFVAQTEPPRLAAISPMSVIADTATSTLAPGGIFNEGFALRWAERVLDGAAPFGQGWEMDVVRAERAAGERSTCEDNQRLHDQRVDSVATALARPYYDDALARPLDPSTFVDRITVPVFLTGQWQDEQTGPHFAALLDRFERAPVRRFTVTNGVHPDGFAPQILAEWKYFLDLYVARRVPGLDAGFVLLAPQLFSRVFGATLPLPADRFAGFTSHEEARRVYESESPLRVIFETGARSATKGAPEGTFEAHFAAWPLPGTRAERLYLHADGGLSAELPAPDGGASSFLHDPAAGARITLSEEVDSADVWNPQPVYDYRPLVPGKAIAFVGPVLERDLVVVGHGSVDLYLRSSASDADLEVNLSELRPDGEESYVQSGWLRASQRKLRSDASELRPTHTHREADAAPLPPGAWTLVRVEIMPMGHVFRAGSRLRLSIDTPGDSRASWRFMLLPHEEPPRHAVAHDAAHPSSLVLPVIDGVVVAGSRPECSWLRGQPCRDYVPLVNTPF